MILRSLAKTGFACAYAWTGGSRFVSGWKRAEAAAPFIVGYHRVVEDYERSKTASIPSMLIGTAMLERHIDWLARRFTIMSLDEIGLRLESGRPFERPTAAITFDDGYGDVYQHVYPLLQRKGVPAAVFVVTGLVGTGRPQIFDRFYLSLQMLQKQALPLAHTLARALCARGFDARPLERFALAEDEPLRLMTLALNAFPQEQIEAALESLEERARLPEDELVQMSPLTWDMIQTMHRSGMTIGSHTARHRLLPCETSETVRDELVSSRRVLEAQLGAEVKHFAYPDGRFNPAVVKAVRAAGYHFGYAVCQSRDRNFPLLTIPRKMLWEGSCLNALGRFSSSIMNCHTHWVFDPRDRCEHDHAG
jgi:peptidoglycan/xylan/chitin deacetylase (PgdA/CDA1 family)